MKRLMLMRHTKSSWASPDTEDFDRSLNKRGKRAARTMGQWIREQGLMPDLALVSSARRTRETWEGLALTGTPDLRDDLYEAAAEAILALVRGAEAGTLLVIGHNPGIAEAGRLLLDGEPAHERFLDYPTGALLVLRFEVDSFAKIAPGSGVLEHFLTPHDLIESA